MALQAISPRSAFSARAASRQKSSGSLLISACTAALRRSCTPSVDEEVHPNCRHCGGHGMDCTRKEWLPAALSSLGHRPRPAVPAGSHSAASPFALHADPKITRASLTLCTGARQERPYCSPGTGRDRWPTAAQNSRSERSRLSTGRFSNRPGSAIGNKCRSRGRRKPSLATPGRLRGNAGSPARTQAGSPALSQVP